MPVPLPAFWFDPSMSLTRWNSQLNVPMAIFSGDVLPYKGVFGEQQLDEVAVCVGAVAHTCKLAEDGKEEAENGGVMRKISKMVLEATSELGSELVLRNGELLFQELNGPGQDFGAASAVLVKYGFIAWRVAA